ncbi:MAG: ribokinase [Anaerolineae bacterium]|nr:ribokinase [Anaerolineae bacterium]
MTENLSTIIPKLADRRILVLGDVILDEYITGKAQRMSREAPIPVLEFQSRQHIPGGASNPASNIVALGSAALQIGIVGEDDTAQHLQDALQGRGIDTSGLITCAEKPTTLKTRILAQMGLRFPQQVARVDTLSRSEIDPATEAKVLAIVQQNLVNADALLVSDYRNGLLTKSLVNAVRERAQSTNVPLFADAQGSLEKYRGFDLVKCNADDAAEILRRDLHTDTDFAEAATELCKAHELRGAMVITRGGDGATVATVAGEMVHIPAPRVSAVYDTVGAGDTWIAVATLARIAGADFRDAVRLANYASGIVVQHLGNYTPSPDELLGAVTERQWEQWMLAQR